MASHLHLHLHLHLQPLIILFLLTFTHILPAKTTQINQGFLLNLTKDPQSHQYTTQLLIGTPQLPTTLVVHLSGQSLWLKCPPSSSSRSFINHGSIQCSMAKSGDRTRSPHSHTVCDVYQQNPITGDTSFGDLAEDVLTVDGLGSPATVDRFLLSCSPEYLVNGLAAGASGILGLGRSKIAFQTQMVNNFNIPRKFTLCLSSTEGFITSGTGAGTGVGTGILKSLSYTPLIPTHDAESEGYYHIAVNSIKIYGRRLAGVDPIGAVEISSTVPYTVMNSTLYGIFTKAYVAAAGAMNLTVVSPVAPFGVCFRSPATVPEIELVLQSEMVKWGIQRRNLMVEVGDSVVCLGFVDGGLGMNGGLIIGGYQLEDHVLEFDLERGMMGFSSSLVMEGGSCGNIRALVSTPMWSL